MSLELLLLEYQSDLVERENEVIAIFNQKDKQVYVSYVSYVHSSAFLASLPIFDKYSTKF